MSVKCRFGTMAEDPRRRCLKDATHGTPRPDGRIPKDWCKHHAGEFDVPAKNQDEVQK